MRVIGRLLLVGFVTLVGVVPLAVSYTLATVVQLLATTVLIMGGTGHPLVSPDGTSLETPYASDYVTTVSENYIVPSGVTGPYNFVAVYSPEEFFPVAGLMTFDKSVRVGRDNMNACVTGSDNCVSHVIPEEATESERILIVGYSQSAVIASLVKRDLMDFPESAPTVPVSFLLLANPMRPNGGILARGFEGLTIPLIGIKFYGPAPTDSNCDGNGTCYETVDVAQQYDLLGGDAPADVVNILAWANSLAAYVYLHGEVPNASLDDQGIIPQGKYGDTTYYLIPAERLPLLMPLEQLRVPGPILAVLDAPLRVLMEASYVRDASPGEHVRFTLLPAADPITVGVNFVRAIPVGIDDGFQEAGFEERPLGTQPAGPYGVGGEDEGGVFDGTAITGGPASEKVFVASEEEEGDEVATDGSEQEKAPDAAPSRTARQLVRDPIRFDRPRPSADQPSGKRPSRIGQGLSRPRPRHTAGADGDKPTGGEPAASGGNHHVA